MMINGDETLNYGDDYKLICNITIIALVICIIIISLCVIF